MHRLFRPRVARCRKLTKFTRSNPEPPHADHRNPTVTPSGSTPRPPCGFASRISYLYPSYSGRELNGHFDVPSKNFVFDEVESFKGRHPGLGGPENPFPRPGGAPLRRTGPGSVQQCHIVHTMGNKASDDPGATGPKLVLGTLFHKDEKAGAATVGQET